MSFAPLHRPTGPVSGPAATLWLAGGLLMLVAGGAPAATAQDRVIDGGSLAIFKRGQLIGVEEFQIRQVVTRSGADVFTLTTTAYYPADNPTHVLSATLRLGDDSLVTSARFEWQHQRQSAVALVTVSNRRVTVRVGAPGRESSREYPGAAPSVMLDDSLFGLHAVRHPAAATGVGLLWPRAGERSRGAVAFHGRAETDVGGVNRMLEHITVRAGDAVRHLWFDEAGRLQKLEAPALELIVVRRP